MDIATPEKTFDDWIDEYYPVPAHDLKDASDEACIKHSILKWKGLSVVKEYGIHIDPYIHALLSNQDYYLFEINSSSCSLCCKHYDYYECSCGSCPLAASLGMGCDKPLRNGVSLFKESLFDPLLMIEALEKSIDCCV